MAGPKGNRVFDVECPQCGVESVYYNGNYGCEECDWHAGSEEGGLTHDELFITETYLLQCLKAATKPSDEKRFRFYLNRLKDIPLRTGI